MNAPVFPLKLSGKDLKRLRNASKAHRKPEDSIVKLALLQFLDAEDQYQAAIQKGLDDIRAGRTIPHEKVVAEFDAMFAVSNAKRKAAAGKRTTLRRRRQ